MSDRFDELVDHPALRPEERERLRRVHDLLLEVGPPPDMPPRLLDAPEPEAAPRVVELRPRRRVLTLLAAALGLAAAGGAGYVLGERGGAEEAAPPVTSTVVRTTVTTVAGTTNTRGPLVSMVGVGQARGASATVQILPRAETGEYPVRVRLRGLPDRQTFELWVVEDGEFEKLCGSFTTGYGTTDEIIDVPYEMRTRDEWVVVRPGTTEPLLRTT